MIKYYEDFVGSYFDVHFTKHSKTTQFLLSCFHFTHVVLTEAVSKVKNIKITSIFQNVLERQFFHPAVTETIGLHWNPSSLLPQSLSP